MQTNRSITLTADREWYTPGNIENYDTNKMTIGRSCLIVISRKRNVEGVIKISIQRYMCWSHGEHGNYQCLRMEISTESKRLNNRNEIQYYDSENEYLSVDCFETNLVAIVNAKN